MSPVKVVRTKAELRAELAPARRAGRTIGLVPTMGALHGGHLSLLAGARERCDVVVMSLFVNPTQFGPGEDLDAYPRDEARDAELAERAGVDLIYAPAPEEVYPPGFATAVEVSATSSRFWTATRAGVAAATSAGSRRSWRSSSTRSAPTSRSSGRRTPSRPS